MPDVTAFKLLQGYLWHPTAQVTPSLPTSLPSGALVALDEVPAPFAFFDNGEPTAGQRFYQFTVLSTFEAEPSNAVLHTRALIASAELDPILNATLPGVGWSIFEDLRAA